MKRILYPGLKMIAIITILYSPAIAQLRVNTHVHIHVDISKPIGLMKPVWAWFGHDEPNYTYMKDGRKLLSELAALSKGPVHMRVHNLLTTGDGTAALKWGSTNAYTEDANGNAVYNWRLVDSIFDTYIQRGIKPYPQIGFMPEGLSSHPQPYRHHWQPGHDYREIYTGWAYPPTDYSKWEELVYQWVKHSVGRYGRKEVESWYWEVWNEPNIDYWKGTMPEFFKLYDYAAHGLKRALPSAKVGGPEVAGGGSEGGIKFMRAFIEHCLTGTNFVTGQTGSPLDVLSFHAKGQPSLINGTVRMNMAPQLHDIQEAFKIVASYPQTKNLPIVIGESDPEGCAACGMATNPANAYRNGTMYSSYTAASIAREYLLADSLKVNLMGSVSWSFEFEDQPWFYGFRDLATNGVDKPVLNVFRMLGMMTGERVAARSNRMYPFKTIIDSSIRSTTDVGVLATHDGRSAAVMIWNYHDDDKEGIPEHIQLMVDHLPAQVTLTHYRIDAQHSNSYEVWKKIGSPQQPTTAQIAKMEAAGALQTLADPQKTYTSNGRLEINMELPRQGVSLIKLAW